MNDEEILRREIALRFAIAASLRARLRGLLATRPHEGTLLLAPCGDVHTFGMRHAIDIAFVNPQGRVIKVCKRVEPNRRISCKGAVAVLERFSDTEERWVRLGDELRLSIDSPEKKGNEQ